MAPDRPEPHRLLDHPRESDTSGLDTRCVKAGAVVGFSGRAFTEASIGVTLAARNLMDDLRPAGQITGGSKPFIARDRSAFLPALDLVVTRLKRTGFGA